MHMGINSGRTTQYRVVVKHWSITKSVRLMSSIKSSLLFHLYVLLAILVLYNLYTLIAIFHLPVSSVFPTQTSGATPYEFLMFTQQWPKAVNESSPLAQFTIHGLWPSKYKSGPVLRCNGTDFDENKVNLFQLHYPSCTRVLQVFFKS